MSLGDSRIPETEAEKEAEVALRLNVGNIPHLGDAEYNQENHEYVFPILVSLPRVIFEEGDQGTEPVDVGFMPELDVGEIHVNALDGEIVSRTNASTIDRRIREKEEEIEIAVQKALVKASGEKFSHLPYPEHRYTPVLDLLSEVILAGSVDKEQFEKFSPKDREKYEKHLDTLIDAGLVRWEGTEILPDGDLLQIQSANTSPSDRLNEAMAVLFKRRVDDIEMMHEILGPHLKIAGYYYRRALEAEGMPKLTQRDFRSHFSGRYTGEKGRLKVFKLSRYLLQLEEVGIIKSEVHLGDRVWVGDGKIEEDIRDQDDYLGAYLDAIS